jgi:hypothetical protein
LRHTKGDFYEKTFSPKAMVRAFTNHGGNYVSFFSTILAVYISKFFTLVIISSFSPF